MGLTHCPLCMGLAVLCALRFSAHALIVWQLRPQAPTAVTATTAVPAAAASSRLQLA